MKALCLRCRAINTGLAEWCHDCGGRLTEEKIMCEKKPTIAELEEILSRPHKGYVIRPDGSIVDHDSRIAELEAKLAAYEKVVEAAQKVVWSWSAGPIGISHTLDLQLKDALAALSQL